MAPAIGKFLNYCLEILLATDFWCPKGLSRHVNGIKEV